MKILESGGTQHVQEILMIPHAIGRLLTAAIPFPISSLGGFQVIAFLAGRNPTTYELFVETAVTTGGMTRLLEQDERAFSKL